MLPVGAPSFAEALRYGAEIFHTLQEGAARARARHRGRRRGRLRTGPAVERGRARDHPRGHRARRFQGRPRRLPRARRGELRVLPGRRLHARVRRAASSPRRSSSTTSPVSRTAIPIITIEDGMAEGDWDGWAHADAAPGPARAARRRRPVRHQHEDPRARASRRGIANSILIKLNQIGTLTETLAAIDMAAEAGYASVVSHRSGETEDSTIADIAVGDACHADQDRFAVAFRPRRQVQPAAAHRSGTRRARRATPAATRSRCRCPVPAHDSRPGRSGRRFC